MTKFYTSKWYKFCLAALCVLLAASVIGLCAMTVPAEAQTNGKFTFTDNSLTDGTLSVNIADSTWDDAFGGQLSGYAATSVKLMDGSQTVYSVESVWEKSSDGMGFDVIDSYAKQSYTIDVVDLLEQGKLSGDVTYTVRCTATTYDNIGMGTDMPSYVESEQISADFSFKLQTVSELPDPPTKTGYTFTGWYTDEECQIPFEEDVIVGNVTLYAGFRPNNYTIVFNGNGSDSGNMNNLAMVYDVEKALTANTFVKNGYAFAGWATSSGGDVEYTDGQTVENLTATDNGTVTLYAVWELMAYTVTFNGNGSVSGSMSNQTLIKDQPAELTENAFVRTGYTFKGWATSSGGSVEYTDGQTVENIGDPGDTVTLYAVWQVNTLTIKFHANGGTGSLSDQSISYGSSASLTAVGNSIQREYYRFVGWATEENGEVVYADGEEIINNTTTDGDGVLNLYAVWERIKCVVTLIVDGQIYAYLEVPAGTPTEDVLGAAGISDVMYKLDGNYPNA